VQFKPARLFREGQCDLGGPNRLVIQIQPKEGAFLSVDAKVPGDRMILRPVHMAFDYGAAFGSAGPEAYERLVLDALLGESTLFIRDDEVEASWRFVDAVRKVWDNQGVPELASYPQGSWGPQKAEGIFADHYQRWYNLDLR
jgi:glucose-6-phosphate 1-dehydrogenase